MIESTTPARALAVYAHPDDPEVSAGGTLAGWARRGAAVHLIVANRGDKGSSDPSTDPDELAVRRAAEVAEAAAVLGLASVEHLDIPDGELDDTVELRGRIVEAIRRRRPEALVAPDPTAVFFGESYVNHRDHRQLGFAVIDSIVPAASPLYFPQAGPPHQVDLVLLSGTLEADAWVDISDDLAAKVTAVACHASRMGGDPELVGRVLSERAADEGRRAGVSYAEGFRRLRF